MIEIVYYAASSLDGYIATQDDGVGWLTPFHQGGEDYGFPKFIASVDALLMGSRTYEVAIDLGEWSTPDKPSWVFTSRDLEIVHPSITLTSEDPEDIVGQLEDEGVQRAWLMGGGELAASFRERGLITDYMIAVIPVVLGAGVPLFAPRHGDTMLELVGHEAFSTGVVLLTYRGGS